MVLITGVLLDRRHIAEHRVELRATTERMAGLIARRMFTRVERDGVTADQLVHSLIEDAEGSVERFRPYANAVLQKDPYIYGIGIAPNFTLTDFISRKTTATDVRPTRVGEDIQANRLARQPNILTTSQQNHLTIIIPVTDADGARWGALAMLVSKDALIQPSGVNFMPQMESNQTFLSLDWLRLALRDPASPQYLAFYGEDSIDEHMPMTWAIGVRGAQWIMQAAPRAGWDVVPSDQLEFRLLIILAGVAIIVPVFIASSLIAERNRNIAKLKAREVSLLDLSQTLRDAKDTTEIKNAELELALEELSNREQQLEAAKEEADAKNLELEIAKSRIEHNSLHDPLTMLSNRRKLDLELDRLSQASQAQRQRFSILHLDLDRFKQINDTLGHAAGDAMLVHASKILARNVRGTDIVARIGGDEFVILAIDNSNAEEMAELSQRIIGEFHQPIDFEGFACRCGVSIGIAQAHGMNIDARRILVNADIALYRAKGLGRNRYEFFTQNLQAEIITHKRTADELLAGIDNHEFTNFYQPQFDARTGTLTGVEALIRWHHPHQGIITPDRFLKIAGDLNVSATLDQIVLETALKDKMRWTALGIKVPKVSVNVSSRRLHDEQLISTLESLSITPGEISFELVESIFLDESEDSSTSNLGRIKDLGIDIEIDDFGTGHTSIVSLLKLKPKRLKIDRQLVMPILNSPQEKALVRSIIEIARSLGVETVAEGVETMQHAVLLRELGCDLLQGFAFAKPLSFDDFTKSSQRGWKTIAA